MPWNYMQVKTTAQGGLDPSVGTGGMSQAEAHAKVQEILDLGSTLDPKVAEAARVWRRGAEDDTVHAMPFFWRIYEYPQNEDPAFAAMAWIDEFAQMTSGRPAAWTSSATASGHAVDAPAPAGAIQVASAPVVGAPAREVQALAVGEPYDPEIRSYPDPAAELRLEASGAQLVLCMGAPDAHVVAAFRTGRAEFALVPDDHYLIWCYQFTPSKKSRNPAAKGPGLTWSDISWEYHCQDTTAVVPGRYGETFVLHLVLVEANTGIVQGLRTVNTPVEFADALRDAVARQAAHTYDPAAAGAQIRGLYDQYTSSALAGRAAARFKASRDGGA